MSSGPMFSFMSLVFKEAGPSALSLLVLCVVIWYQERRHGKDRKESRSDFKTLNDTNRDDRNLMATALQSQSDKMINVVADNTKAVTELTTHIERCSRN